MSRILVNEDAQAKLNKLEESLILPRKLAAELGILKPEIDCGYRTAQIIAAARVNPKFTDFMALHGKYGPDANIKGIRNLYPFEIKSLEPEGSLLSGKNYNSVRVSSHVSMGTIGRYRKNEWIFGLFHNGLVFAVYWAEPIHLEKYFKEWERQLMDSQTKYVNCPSINIIDIIKNSELIFNRHPGRLFGNKTA